MPVVTCFTHINTHLEIVQTHLWLVATNCRQINWTSKWAQLHMTAHFRCLEVVFKPWEIELQRAHHTPRLSSVRALKWDRCWGLERPQWDIENDGLARSAKTIKKGGNAEAGGSAFTTPDLTLSSNLFSLIQNERKVAFVAHDAHLHYHPEQWFPHVRPRRDKASKCWWNQAAGGWVSNI